MRLELYSILLLFAGQLDGIKLSDILVSVFLALLITFVYEITCMVKRKQRSVLYLILLFLSILYFEITILITIIRREPGTSYHSGKIVPYFQWGVINGDVYGQRQFFYNLLNVFLFIPIGFMLKGLEQKASGLKDDAMTALTGFLISFCIELLQIITKRGTFEITDILTNFIGTCLGIIIYELLKRLFGHERSKKQNIN
jgi:glycopeptide antibiotics resistance protein